MAQGDLVFSHVAADGGALVCASNPRKPAELGRLVFYRQRSYWWCELSATLKVWYDGAAWDTSRSPFVNSAMKDWADYLGMDARMLNDRAEGTATLYGYWGWVYGTTAPTTSDGAVRVNSSNVYPYTSGRYYGETSLDAVPRIGLRFGSRSAWYQVPATRQGLGAVWRGSADIDARGAQYATGNGYDARLSLVLALHSFAHDPNCPH